MSGLAASAQAAVVTSNKPPLWVLLSGKHNYRPWLTDHTSRTRVQNLRTRSGDGVAFNPTVTYAKDPLSAEIFVAVYRPNAHIGWAHLTPEFRAEVQDALCEGNKPEDILACHKSDLAKIAKQIRAVYGFTIPTVPPKSTMGITATRVLDLRSQGKTWDQIASIFGVSHRTMYVWRSSNGFGAKDGHSDCSGPRSLFRSDVLRAFRNQSTDQELLSEFRSAMQRFEQRIST